MPEVTVCVCVSPSTAGLHGGVHLPTAPPHYSAMEEMGVGSSRAKRYSSQRQRAVPEPAPPLHLGVMEGHYYEPSRFTRTASHHITRWEDLQHHIYCNDMKCVCV